MLVMYSVSMARGKVDQVPFHLTLTRRENKRPNLLLNSLGRNRKNSSAQVLFRPFEGNPKYHNTSVNGEFLPGSYFNNTLFLHGLRLTASYDKSDSEVHVDLFGFPGDFVGKQENTHCDVHYLPKQWNLTNYDTFQKGEIVLYCQLECGDMGISLGDCGVPIPMTFIPLVSADKNQQSNSLIWRCNVTKYLERKLLLEKSVIQHLQSSIRVTIYLSQNGLDERPPTIHQVTQIDIPLHTSVAGHGGPQIRANNSGYFSTIQQKSPYRLGMCMIIYELRAIKYIPEFLQHHQNVGIDHFVIGVNGTLGSDLVSELEKLLQLYIDKEIVELQAVGLSDYFQCRSHIIQLQFYHQCLYNFKALTKYVVNFDVDEYWIPPERLEVSGYNNFTLHRFGVDKNASITGNYGVNNSNISMQRFITQSRLSSFPTFVTTDKIWKDSNYSTSISISDSIQAIDEYHKQQGCSDKWCYHVLPSYSVSFKSNMDKFRTKLVANDCQYREHRSNLEYRKLIIQTRFAMMSGIHDAGSCKFPGSAQYVAYASSIACFPACWTKGEFGSMHHFKNLLAIRANIKMDGAQIDEYVSRFGSTVIKQLKRRKRTFR
jgi:Glycosyltransferase family 92